MRKDSVWNRMKLPPTVKKAEEVAKAFAEGREARTRYVRFNPESWWAGNTPREGIRDMVKQEDGALTYYLWGSSIATLNGDVLTLGNCGYETRMTVRRLQSIFYVMISIHSCLDHQPI